MGRFSAPLRAAPVVSLSSPDPAALRAGVDWSTFNPVSTISYKDVTDILRNAYNFEESIQSTCLDILALYLKGQKILYTESKSYCEKKLNVLMLPAIFIAAVCSILNFILKDVAYGTIIISCLNAFNSFLLSLISYLKLDGMAEAHKTSAYKFQKLESLCEFHSGKYLFFKDAAVNVQSFVQNIEKEVMEIRESNQFIVPESVRDRFPTIYTTNVFTLVKEIQVSEVIIINHLKTTVQKLHAAIKVRDDLTRQLTEARASLDQHTHEMHEVSIQVQRLRAHAEHLENEEQISEQESTDSEPEELARNRRTQRDAECDALARQLIVTQPVLEQLQTRVEQQSYQVRELKSKYDESVMDVSRFERAKDEAFVATVRHRMRYLKLSRTFRRDQGLRNVRAPREHHRLADLQRQLARSYDATPAQDEDNDDDVVDVAADDGDSADSDDEYATQVAHPRESFLIEFCCRG